MARLVTEGLSNREVGSRLVVSVKTVEYHLGHVYDKLGVRSGHSWWPSSGPGPPERSTGAYTA